MTVLWYKRSKKYLIKDFKKCLSKRSKKVPYQGSKKGTLSRYLNKVSKKVPYQGTLTLIKDIKNGPYQGTLIKDLKSTLSRYLNKRYKNCLNQRSKKYLIKEPYQRPKKSTLSRI